MLNWKKFHIPDEQKSINRFQNTQRKSIYLSDVNIFLLFYCLKPQIIMTNIHIISKQRDPRMARSLSEFEFEDDVGLSKNSNVVIIESDEEDD